MARYVLRGVLPALAAAAVVLILLIAACGFVDLGLSIAAAMNLDTLGKAVNIAFIAFLFVFATGIVPCIVLKKLQITNLPAYLLAGSVCGVLAEYCYLFNDEFWFGWDFSEPTFMSVLASAIRDMPDLLAGMVPMLPWSAIPVVVGLLGSGLYWTHARRPFANIATLGELVQVLRRGVLAVLAVAGVYLLYCILLAAFMRIELTLVAAQKAFDFHQISQIAFNILLLLVWSGLTTSFVLHALRVRSIGAYVATGAVSGVLLEYFFLFAFEVGGHLAPINVAYGAPGDYLGSLTTFDLLCEVFRRVPSIGREMLTYAGSTVVVQSGIGAVFGCLFWWFVVRRSARKAGPQQ